jgi:hypothetical protein
LRAPVILDLPQSYLFGCFLVAARAVAQVDDEDRRQLVAAVARARDRIQTVTEQTEKTLMGGALKHQGVRIVRPSDSLRAEFLAAASSARDRKAAQLLPPALLSQTRALISTFRAERGAHAR